MLKNAGRGKRSCSVLGSLAFSFRITSFLTNCGLQTSSISAFSREKLERHFTDAVRKLRAKEKELSSVSAERDALTQQLSSAQDSALQSEELRARLEVSSAGCCFMPQCEGPASCFMIYQSWFFGTEVRN